MSPVPPGTAPWDPRPGTSRSRGDSRAARLPRPGSPAALAAPGARPPGGSRQLAAGPALSRGAASLARSPPRAPRPAGLGPGARRGRRASLEGQTGRVGEVSIPFSLGAAAMEQLGSLSTLGGGAGGGDTVWPGRCLGLLAVSGVAMAMRPGFLCVRRVRWPVCLSLGASLGVCGSESRSVPAECVSECPCIAVYLIRCVLLAGVGDMI